jgi:fructoselysine-6-P-deglycase FrlB-like protein
VLLGDRYAAKVRKVGAIQGELLTQPDCWVRAAERSGASDDLLPRIGERVLVIGCGTSFYMAQSYARAREDQGFGLTDAVVASEISGRRSYDRSIALSRSGTTTEVLRALESISDGSRTLVITAVEASPIVGAVDDAVVLEFADESAVVQTRFATSALAFLLTSVGHDLAAAVADARAALEGSIAKVPSDAYQYVFLGRGWSIGLANEAGLKMREAAQAWSEAYPALEYRHGPISTAGRGTVVWSLDPLDPDLAEEVESTGATIVSHGLHPMAELVMVQRLAVWLAEARGLNPDEPPHLTRSVVLP